MNSSMRYGYLLGICFILYLIISTIATIFYYDEYSENIDIIYIDKDEYTFYVVLFAYTCHNNLPDIFLVINNNKFNRNIDINMKNTGIKGFFKENNEKSFNTIFFLLYDHIYVCWFFCLYFLKS